MRYDEKGQASSRAQMAVAAPQDVAKKMLVMLRSATEDSSFPRLALVRHGRREERVRSRAEERVGVDLILPGVHGHLPVQHLQHRIGAHRLWGKEMRGRAGCGAIGAGCELSTSRIWCSILESSVTSSRLNTSCTRLCREDINRGSASRLTLTASTQHPRKIGRTE